MDKKACCNAGRLEDRATSELIGIAKGLIADGVVNEQESAFLVQWLEQNSTFDSWPFDVINKRVGEMLADGKIDADERQELLSLGWKSAVLAVVPIVLSVALVYPLSRKFLKQDAKKEEA